MYGGAFDPPHNAHVALARAAIRQLGLDELRVLPTGDAWHKPRTLTLVADRVAMAKLAFAGVDRAVVDEREVTRGGPTYTIDTLAELEREAPGAQLFLVLGEDQALAFKTWRAWEEVARRATLCVARRGLTASSRTQLGLPHLDIALPNMPVSATAIREHIRRGEDISMLVPPAVASYIASHHLYQGH